MSNTPATGEVWTLKDNNGAKRECLVLNSTGDGYTTGWYMHSYSKHTENILLKVPVKGERYIDPRKITYWHTNCFQSKLYDLKTDDYIRVKSRAAMMLGLGVQNEDLENRCALAEQNVASMGRRIETITAERDLLKSLCEKTMAARLEEAEQSKPKPAIAEGQPTKKMTQAEYQRLCKERNKKKLLPKQAYIGVKLKSVRMSQVTCGMMIGVNGNTVCGWIHGSSKANWGKLETVFPGIEQEADRWAEKQK